MIKKIASARKQYFLLQPEKITLSMKTIDPKDPRPCTVPTRWTKTKGHRLQLQSNVTRSWYFWMLQNQTNRVTRLCSSKWCPFFLGHPVCDECGGRCYNYISINITTITTINNTKMRHKAFFTTWHVFECNQLIYFKTFQTYLLYTGNNHFWEKTCACLKNVFILPKWENIFPFWQ